MITVSNILRYLQEIAPFSCQESYDNSGLLIGEPNTEVKGILVSLDCTEAIVDEAIANGANVIVSHHPIIFKGLKRLTGSNYVERTVMKALRNNIALVAIHTNLDNMKQGVNAIISDRLGLVNQRILAQKSGALNKLVVFVPETHLEAVRIALFEGGAGEIGDYDSCSFDSPGDSTFKPLAGATPFIGKVGELERVKEARIEVLVPTDRLSKVIAGMTAAHPYEEVAYDIIPLANKDPEIGAGMVGELETETDPLEFLQFVKQAFGCKVIRHTELLPKKIKRVALCGGAGGFLLSDAKRAGADIFITADYKYHEFFDAENQLVIADIGHFESEQYTSDWLVAKLNKKFTTFAVRLTNVNTNPINYL